MLSKFVPIWLRRIYLSLSQEQKKRENNSKIKQKQTENNPDIYNHQQK